MKSTGVWLAPVCLGTLCAQAVPQMLPREWGAPIPLRRVVLVAATAEAGRTVTQALTKRGVASEELGPEAVQAANGLQWTAAAQAATVILSGGIHTNRALLPLYAHYLSFADAAWPGGDDYAVRSVARPFGAGTGAIALEASSAAGELAAATRFAELLAGAPAEGLPATLEVHISQERLASLNSIGDGGMRYALGGNPDWAAAGVRGLLAAINPETGFLPHGDYGIERWIREYHYLQDAPGIAPEDRQRLDQAVLLTAIHSAGQWWRRRDGSAIGGRHQTMGTSAFTAAVQLLRRRGQPDPEAQRLLDGWWSECLAYWANACSTFHDDLEGWPSYCCPEPTLDWALMLGLDGYLREQLPLAVQRAAAVTDPLGFYAGTGTYEECRPGDVYKPTAWGWLLRVADHFHPGQDYGWLQENVPRIGVWTWGLGRDVAGRRRFHSGAARAAPAQMLGITALPLGPYRYRDLTPADSQPPLARCIEKLSCRNSFDPNGQYFVLQGFDALRADNLAPLDANSLIRCTDLGHVWLHANTEKQGNLFRSGVFCSDGFGCDRASGVCELRSLHNGEHVGLAASHLRGHGACDWTRNVIWQRGGYLVLIDVLQQTQPGEFALACSFRTPQRAWLEADGMQAREGDATFRVRCADGVRLALEGGAVLEGAAVATLLRETQRLDGGPGSLRVFRNLLYAADSAHPSDLEVRPLGDRCVLIRGNLRGALELALAVANPTGGAFVAGTLDTDAAVAYLGTAGWARTGGSFLKLGDWRTEAAEGSGAPQFPALLEALWAATPAATPAAAAGATPEGAARPLWRFDGFTPLAPAVLAPALSAEPAGEGLLSTLLDGVVTRWATVRWPAGAEVVLSLDLHETKALVQIAFQTGPLGEFNRIPDSASYPAPRPLQAEFSTDGFRQDVRARTLTAVSDCTFEGLHKGSVFPILRWTCRGVGETARFVRLRFARDAWPGQLGLNEVAIRTAGPTAARTVGAHRRDVDGDGVPELLVWTDQAELALLRADGSPVFRRTFPGYITAAEGYPDLDQAGPRVLVTTREARLYCLGLDGAELWRTDFLASANQNSDLPTGYSLGLLRRAGAPPLLVVGNYNLASFVSSAGEVLQYVRLPAAYQTMTLSRGTDTDGDGLDETISTEVWGCLSVLDAGMRLRHGGRLLPGRGVLLDYWQPPDAAQAKVLVCSEAGLGLFDLKALTYDWQQAVQPITDCAIARLAGQDGPLAFVGKEDGWLLAYDGAGQVRHKILLGETVRGVTAIPMATGSTLVAVALPGRIETVEPASGSRRVLAGGEYVRLLPGERPGVLWACGARGGVGAFAVLGEP